jgi:hypothetical protein
MKSSSAIEKAKLAISYVFLMNDMFANSRGHRVLAKYLYITNHVWGHSLDFVSISTMGKREYSTSVLNRLSGGAEFNWVSRSPCGRSGTYY